MHDSGAIDKSAASTEMSTKPGGHDDAVDEPQPPRVEILPAQTLDILWHAQGKHVSNVKMADLTAFSNINWTPIVLGLFGILVIGVSFINNFATMLSIPLALAGVSIIIISILYYFVTPSRLIVSEVSDAMTITNTELISTLLEPLVGDAKGIYIPSSILGITQVLILTKDSEFSKAYSDSTASITGINEAGKNCLFLTPPGYGLFSYVKSLGASFTSEGLGGEIKDVLVNGLELAQFVEVTRISDSLHVRVDGLSDSSMCKAMRSKGIRSCDQIGCPICSFIACMVVEGTGKRAMISNVKHVEKAIELTYKLL